MSSIVIGVDSSTQSVKVEARRTESGEIVAVASAPHPATTPPVSEHDPREWWAALRTACADLPADVRSAATAIAVAGQQHGLVLLDEAGEPVRKAKLWNDTTSAAQSQRLVETLGAEEWAAQVGSVPVPAFTITKLAWVADNEPDSLARAVRAMLPHDYLTWRLTDRFVTDRGDASGTGWYDAATGQERDSMIQTAAPGWGGARPEVLGPVEPAGEITVDAAGELGLPSGVVVGPGTGDNMAAGLGLGLATGDVVISLGTSGTVFAESSTPTRDPSGAVAGFASATGAFLPLVCTLNATKVTDRVGEWLGLDAAGAALLATEAFDDPGETLLVPYFDGERTPNLPDATGMMAGLTNGTTRAQLALAAHDGVVCGLLDGLDALVACGATLDGDIVLIGGGNRSPAYRQRVADLAGRRVRIPDATEVVATGAAVQATAVVTGAEPGAIAARWSLGHGHDVEPERDGAFRRAQYAELVGPLLR